MKVNKIQSFQDHRGTLTPFCFKDCPFEVKRIFTVHDVPKGTVRGGHAHKENIQYLFCVQGHITVSLFDGVNHDINHIGAGECVLVDKMIWDTQRFNTGDDVLMVLCSKEYDEKDYLRNMKEYLAIVNG